MRISVRYASWLLPLLALPVITGCDKKTQSAQQQALAPPIVDTPPRKPATVSTADLPPPVIGNPQPAAPPKPTTAQTTEAPKKPVHHTKKPAATTPAPAPTETASTTAAPSVSAIGQLSQGASGDLRTQTEDTITATEKGVNSITRTLTDSEVKTAAQIHEFLKKAREALNTDDVDGAHTLAMKAKVLLTELNQ
jgi:hypothetical protein